jgi:THO complex subunit 1
VGDLTFRRHILVQILITLNFILSWTADAKKKYEGMNTPNKSVMYSGEFGEEEAKWARDTKNRIADYMRKDQPGRFFYRMVDTVLARDKNWVYWKMAGCEPIRRDPITPELWAEAQASAQRATMNKRLRPIPLNAVPMEFLKEKDRDQVMEELKNTERYKIPDLDSFKVKISDDDFAISMAANEQEKARLVASKASKSWRALRIARGFKLAAFDKIDDPNDISLIFEPLENIDAEKTVEDVAAEADMPANRETVIISGPPGVGKSTLVEKLLEAHKGVFGRVVRHTTREPAEGEANGGTFHFVKALEFNQLRDGDRLVEYTEQDGIAYGTSSKAIETVTESGKVPVIELDMEVSTHTYHATRRCDYTLLTQPL